MRVTYISDFAFRASSRPRRSFSEVGRLRSVSHVFIKGVFRIETREISNFAAKLASNKKAEDIVVLDMRKATNFCEYFLICSGNSQKQIASISDAIEEGLLKKGVKALNTNWKQDGGWSLLDYGSVIIHIFEKELRELYNLERLWIDAKRVRLPKD